ncbi:hypothetical protein HDA40_006707 [Hamadaea flava]|uniref:Uncharacterized protein n=1 Tax=Hamadaea flava TaxID=1742688 RepID=A0ABV8LSE9_9ACTN|nr:hypothetical protein [Hamadaea flava]MCP2328200.1 hypothetical protein [Hamadaea flava]
MSYTDAQVDAALEAVITAAREHLAAVRAAGGKIDDDEVWRTYVALNNSSVAYDDALLDVFGEVTPWNVDSIDADKADQFFGEETAAGDDPHPRVISVRQRRDYRVPSVTALLKAGQEARDTAMGEDSGAVESVSEALVELLQAGDGSLSALDIPELEPLDGLVAVAEVDEPLDPETFEESDGAGPFTLSGSDRLIGRMDEHLHAEDDDHDHEH